MEAINELMDQGQHQAAEELARSELEGRNKLGRYILLVTLSSVLGERYRFLEAWQTIEEARHLHQELPPEKRWSAYHERRGFLALALGQLELAAGEFAAYRAKGLPLRADLHDCFVALAADDFPTAESLARKLLQTIEDMPEPERLADPGDLRRIAAYAHWRQHLEDGETIETAISDLRRASEIAAGTASRLESLRNLVEVYLVCGRLDEARVALDDVDGPAAAMAPELAGGGFAALRARLDLAQPTTNDALVRDADAVAQALDAELDRWRQLPPQPGGVGILNYPERTNTLTTAIAVANRLHPLDPTIGFELFLRFDALSTMTRRLDGRQATLAAIRAELLPPDGAMLLVVPSLLGTVSYWITSDELLVHEQGHVESVRQLASAMREELIETDAASAASRSLRLRHHGQQVLDILLPPAWQKRLRSAPALIVVQAGLLDDLLFEALPLADDGWLGSRCAVSHLPSFSAGLSLAARCHDHSHADPVPSLFAATTPAGSADASKLVPLDLHELIDDWSDMSATHCIQSAAATATGFGQQPASSAFRCVIGHGTLVARRDDDSRRGALALAGPPGATLSCADVEAAGLASACTLLASCMGARGPRRRGDDASAHLAGAFLVGGADAVVASEDPLTVGLAVRTARGMRRELAAGATAAEAMRLVRATERGPLPSLGLRVWGLGHRVMAVKPAPEGYGRTSLLAAGAAAALLAALGLRRARRITGDGAEPS